MAYHGRRKAGRTWPVAVLPLLLLVAVAVIVERHPVETAFAGALGRLDAAVSAPNRSTAGTTGPAQPDPTFTVTLDRPVPLGDVPSPAETADAYLKAWSAGHYAEMYDVLSSDAQASLTKDAFVQRYQAITSEATITAIT